MNKSKKSKSQLEDSSDDEEEIEKMAELQGIDPKLKDTPEYQELIELVKIKKRNQVRRGEIPVQPDDVTHLGYSVRILFRI